MTKFKQNIVYAFILVLVFFICIHFFNFNNKTKAKGIYLPRYSSKFSPLNPNKVKICILKYKDNIKENIGQIRVFIHIANKNDYLKFCNKNIEEAVKLAAKYGANKIKYICLSSDNKRIDQLSTVQLYAYAFRD